MHEYSRHIFFLVLIAALLPLSLAFAQVMQSSSYRIQSDSINVGGAFSSSSNYRLEDTSGEIATGFSSSTNYGVGAGYQQMQETYLAMTSPADVTMSPSLGGVTGGTSNGSTAVTVTTDNPAGYTLAITASTSPAMQGGGGDVIDDYAPVAVPDFTFTTLAGDSHFGYSPEGTDIANRFRDFGGVCNSGSGDTALACWDGLSTTPASIASRSSGNHPSGITTTIRFRVGIGSSAAQVEGIYTATTTLTALPL